MVDAAVGRLSGAVRGLLGLLTDDPFLGVGVEVHAGSINAKYIKAISRTPRYPRLWKCPF